MTTETLPHTPDPGVRVLLGAVRTGAAGALVVVVVAALTGQAADVRAAVVGAVVTLTVLTLGAFAVGQVARILPAASLLVALLTYTLQVAVLGLALWWLGGSGLLDDTLSASWLAAAVMAATVGWMIGQVVLATRARIPAYDLPAAGEQTRTEAAAP